MVSVNLPNLLKLSVENFQIDLNSPSDLGLDLSFLFYLPNGNASFEETRLWFDMNQWRETLKKINEGNFDGVQIYDLSKKITFSFASEGLAARVRICINRRIARSGFMTAEFEKRTEFDSVNRFSHFMRTVTEEYKLLL